jgi:hypothetical protein
MLQELLREPYLTPLPAAFPRTGNARQNGNHKHCYSLQWLGVQQGTLFLRQYQMIHHVSPWKAHLPTMDQRRQARRSQ